MIFLPLLGELFCGGKNKKRDNWFEMSDLFSSLLIHFVFTIIKTVLSTFFTVSKFYKNLVKWALTEIEWSVGGTTTLDRECRISAAVTLYWFPMRHFRFKEFNSLVIWIWNPNIAISTIVGTSSHITTTTADI